MKQEIYQINTTDISKIKKIIQPGYSRLCRGQSDCNWPLECSFFRDKEEKSISCKELFGKTWDDSDENIFKTTFPTDLNNSAIKAFPHLGLLIQLQQNYNKQTPLLDVSHDIYMPLFCACGEGKQNMDKNGKLFVIEYLCYTDHCNNIYGPEMNILTNQTISTFNDRMHIQAGVMLKTCMYAEGKLYFCDISQAKNIHVSEYIIPKDLKFTILKNLAIELNEPNLEAYFYGKDY